MSMNLFGGKRLKLGIWGLGRGGAFLESAKALDIDIVAGCDFNEARHEYFRSMCPDAALTKDEDEFLAMDFDAVLIATYCPAHAKHAIKALKAGKHVLCEVTAFLTPAQGVELVETVEATGLVYNLAENYPFTKENMYLAKLYREGVFGELTYAEYDYVHGGSNPCAFYPDGEPMQPGNQLHHWRGWLNYHYYCTHSLGPMMVISGLRPTRVVSLPEDVSCPGCVHGKGRKTDGIVPNLSAFSPSLIQMSNGCVVRNLMGGTSCNSFQRRLFGTRASANLNDGLILTLGADGNRCTPLKMDPQWEVMGAEAEKAGHGGGDFWELYYFARQILTGEKAPWDVYAASDVTITGIQALRSALAEGEPMEVPDFRDKSVRERYRNDNFLPPHIDPARIFPDDQDLGITGDFAPVCKTMIPLIRLVRTALDGMKVYSSVRKDQRIVVIEAVKELRERIGEVQDCYRRMRRIADAYPESQGGIAMLEKLDVGEEALVMDTEKLTEKLNDFLLNA